MCYEKYVTFGENRTPWKKECWTTEIFLHEICFLFPFSIRHICSFYLFRLFLLLLLIFNFVIISFWHTHICRVATNLHENLWASTPHIYGRLYVSVEKKILNEFGFWCVLVCTRVWMSMPILKFIKHAFEI